MIYRNYIVLILTVISVFIYWHVGTEEIWAVRNMIQKESDQEIPNQAIRLRILANSDQVGDQALKRRVRDVLIKEIKKWAKQPQNVQEARKLIRNHLLNFQKLAERTVSYYHYSYPVKVDFGQVPFPTKLYGNSVYPAGNYEALRVTLGKGQGGNWWCVLFPPLCFIDMNNSDAVPQKQEPILSASTKKELYTVSEEVKEQPVQIRFFLLDQLKNLITK